MYKSIILALAAAASTTTMAAPLTTAPRGTGAPPVFSEFGLAITIGTVDMPLTAVRNGDTNEMLLVARPGAPTAGTRALSNSNRPDEANLLLDLTQSPTAPKRAMYKVAVPDVSNSHGNTAFVSATAYDSSPDVDFGFHLTDDGYFYHSKFSQGFFVACVEPGLSQNDLYLKFAPNGFPGCSRVGLKKV